MIISLIIMFMWKFIHMDIVHLTDNSYFYNGNVDPNSDCLSSYTVSSCYYMLQQFIGNVGKSGILSVILMNC